jgi:hypothetical protein
MKWKWVRFRRRPQLVRALLPVTTQAIQNYISLPLPSCHIVTMCAPVVSDIEYTTRPIELLLDTAGSFASNGGIRREFAFRSDHGQTRSQLPNSRQRALRTGE